VGAAGAVAAFVTAVPAAADAHANGIAVWVWMTDRSRETGVFCRSLLDVGVDGLLVAAPALARGVIDDAGLRWEPPCQG
jgi:hypothetical protein